MQNIIIPLIAGLLILTSPAMAENSTHTQGYTIHHNAIKANFLTPEIASAYRIQRSKYRGLLNVSVIKELPGTTGKPVMARITVEATNLTGLQKSIQLREIREEGAIYYIDDFPIINGEIVTFRLQVTPEGASKPIKAKLIQQFFVN